MGIARKGAGGLGILAYPDVLRIFFPHPNRQFLAFRGVQKSKRLPRWFVHFLAHWGNVKKQIKNWVRKNVFHSAHLTRGGGAKAIRAMLMWKQHISKRGFSYLRFVYSEGMRLY